KCPVISYKFSRYAHIFSAQAALFLVLRFRAFVMIVYLLLAVVAFFVCFALFANRLLGLPPGPPPLPLIGNILSFGGSADNMDRKLLEWKQKYGNIFTVWIPVPMVVIGDHKTMIESIVKDGEAYSHRYVRKVLNKLANGGDYGLVMNDNAIWKEQRRFALHSLRDVGFGTSAVEDSVCNLAHEAVSRWKNDHEKEIDVTPNVMAAVANTIWKLIFDKTLPFEDPLFNKVRFLMDETFPQLMRPYVFIIEVVPVFLKLDPLFGGIFKKVLELNNQFLEILRKEIQEAEASDDPASDPNCYVHSFVREMKRRELSGEGEGSFSRLQLAKAAADVWGAGFETTVTTLRYAVHYLVNYPEVQRKMQKEIDETVGDKTIRMVDQKNLPYCCAVIQELQRIANILPLNLPRQVAFDTQIEGFTLKKGTTVVPQFQLVHCDPAEFERPDYFCPERFINEKGEFVKDPRVTPFSMGKRACLGENLARLELFVFLTTFVQHIEFASPTVVPPKLETIFGFTKPPKPFTVVVKDRTRI
ncbi:hypothetical protein PFISCL1PPCAC_22354, partial [Pristionchus fissidentatus]